MNSKELTLAARMLEMASDEFGDHGCNDMDDESWEGWTKQERTAFVKEYHENNGDPEEYSDGDIDLPDFCVFDLLAAKLLKEAESH